MRPFVAIQSLQAAKVLSPKPSRASGWHRKRWLKVTEADPTFNSENATAQAHKSSPDHLADRTSTDDERDFRSPPLDVRPDYCGMTGAFVEDLSLSYGRLASGTRHPASPIPANT
jgi:hypothetical protein